MRLRRRGQERSENGLGKSSRRKSSYRELNIPLGDLLSLDRLDGVGEEARHAVHDQAGVGQGLKDSNSDKCMKSPNVT